MAQRLSQRGGAIAQDGVVLGELRAMLVQYRAVHGDNLAFKRGL